MPYKHENVFGGELSSCQENMSRTQWVYVCTTLCSIDLSWSASDRRVCTALPLADDVCAPVVRSISATADNGEICGKNIALLRPRSISCDPAKIPHGLLLFANELGFECEDKMILSSILVFQLEMIFAVYVFIQASWFVTLCYYMSRPVRHLRLLYM